MSTLSDDPESYLRDLSEKEQKIQGGIWNVIHIYSDSSGGYYSGGYDNDAGVCEPINSSNG